jgi:hypothetical protein
MCLIGFPNPSPPTAQIMAELAAQGVQLSAPLAERVAQRVDRPLGFVDSPGKAYPFLREDGGLGGLGSPAGVARAARRSRAKHAGNFTPTSPGFSNGNGNFSPAAVALRAPIAAAVAANAAAGAAGSATSGRLFVSPPPQAREYFTDMKSSDFFSAESMAYGGNGHGENGNMGKAAHATHGSRTARAFQPSGASVDAAHGGGGNGGPLSELSLNAHSSARAALVSAPKRCALFSIENCIIL